MSEANMEIEPAGGRGTWIRAGSTPTLLSSTIQAAGSRREPCGCVIGRLRNVRTGHEAFYVESRQINCRTHSPDYWVPINPNGQTVRSGLKPSSDVDTARNAEERLRRNVRRLMEAKKLTRNGLAQAAAKSPPWASGYLGKGRLRFPLDRLDQVAAFLGVRPADLFR